jgi:hypothetical protein
MGQLFLLARMLYTVSIRLETPMLGSQPPDTNGVRRFRRGKNNGLLIPVSQWESLFVQACEDMGMDPGCVKTLKFPETIRAPATQLYTRTYNRTKVDRFESIQKNAVLKFQLLVRNVKDIQTVGAPRLNHLFTHVGEWLGISPWGSKFNYGRFSINHITPVRYTEPEEHANTDKKKLQQPEDTHNEP